MQFQDFFRFLICIIIIIIIFFFATNIFALIFFKTFALSFYFWMF